MGKQLPPKNEAEIAIELEKIRKLKQEYLSKDLRLQKTKEELLNEHKNHKNETPSLKRNLDALRKARTKLSEEYLQKLRPYLIREIRLEKRLRAINRINEIRTKRALKHKLKP